MYFRPTWLPRRVWLLEDVLSGRSKYHLVRNTVLVADVAKQDVLAAYESQENGSRVLRLESINHSHHPMTFMLIPAAENRFAIPRDSSLRSHVAIRTDGFDYPFGVINRDERMEFYVICPNRRAAEQFRGRATTPLLTYQPTFR